MMKAALQFRFVAKKQVSAGYCSSIRQKPVLVLFSCRLGSYNSSHQPEYTIIMYHDSFRMTFLQPCQTSRLCQMIGNFAALLPIKRIPENLTMILECVQIYSESAKIPFH